MHQPQLTMQHPSTIHPASMHVSAGLPTGHHFLPSPALASPVGSGVGNSAHQANPPLAANAPCSTLFVANLGQFVSEHELKEVFSSIRVHAIPIQSSIHSMYLKYKRILVQRINKTIRSRGAGMEPRQDLLNKKNERELHSFLMTPT